MGLIRKSMNSELINCLLVQVNNGVSLDEAVINLKCSEAYADLLPSQQAELHRAEAERAAGFPLAQQRGCSRSVGYLMDPDALARYQAHRVGLPPVSAEVTARLQQLAERYQTS